jgi:hypothetical protein
VQGGSVEVGVEETADTDGDAKLAETLHPLCRRPAARRHRGDGRRAVAAGAGARWVHGGAVVSGPLDAAASIDDDLRESVIDEGLRWSLAPVRLQTLRLLDELGRGDEARDRQRRTPLQASAAGRVSSQHDWRPLLGGGTTAARAPSSAEPLTELGCGWRGAWLGHVGGLPSGLDQPGRRRVAIPNGRRFARPLDPASRADSGAFVAAGCPTLRAPVPQTVRYRQRPAEPRAATGRRHTEDVGHSLQIVPPAAARRLRSPISWIAGAVTTASPAWPLLCSSLGGGPATDPTHAHPGCRPKAPSGQGPRRGPSEGHAQQSCRSAGGHPDVEARIQDACAQLGHRSSTGGSGSGCGGLPRAPSPST